MNEDNLDPYPPYKRLLDRALWVASPAAPVVDEFLLMETNDFLLLEDGSKIVLE
jgi:hypothetical protein